MQRLHEHGCQVPDRISQQGDSMILDVTQNLIVDISPVNNPSKTNEHGEQQGYYHAFVSHEDYQIEVARREWMRGIVHSGAGYGAHSTARIAVLNAVDDYIEKFGPLCITDTEAIA